MWPINWEPHTCIKPSFTNGGIGFFFIDNNGCQYVHVLFSKYYYVCVLLF